MESLANAQVRPLVEENEFDPVASLREAQVVVWDIPFTGERVPGLDGLMRTIDDVSMFEVTEAIDQNKRLPYDQQEKFQTLVIAADECGVLSNGHKVPLPRMGELAAVHRSYEIFYKMANQLYNAFDRTLRGQIEAVLVTRSDPEDAQLLAERFGYRPVWYYNGVRTDHTERTSSLGRNQSIGKVVGEITASEGERHRQVKSAGWDQHLELLIPAEEIGKLPMGTILVYLPGHAPIRVYGRDSTDRKDLVQGETIRKPVEFQREAYTEQTPEWMRSTSTPHHHHTHTSHGVTDIERNIMRAGREYRQLQSEAAQIQAKGPRYTPTWEALQRKADEKEKELLALRARLQAAQNPVPSP